MVNKNNFEVIKEEYCGMTPTDFEKLKEYGVSPEEIENLKDACALSDTVDLLPKNLAKFFKKYNEVLGSNLTVAQHIEKQLMLSQTDPKFFVELGAVLAVLHPDIPNGKAVKVEKITRTDISVEEAKEEAARLEKQIASLVKSFNELSPSEKKGVLDFINKNK